MKCQCTLSVYSMMILYIVVFLYSIVLMCLLKNIGKLHQIILLLLIFGIIIKTFSFILKFIYYEKYFENHYPTEGFKIASKILEYFSDLFYNITFDINHQRMENRSKKSRRRKSNENCNI